MQESPTWNVHDFPLVLDRPGWFPRSRPSCATFSEPSSTYLPVLAGFRAIAWVVSWRAAALFLPPARASLGTHLPESYQWLPDGKFLGLSNYIQSTSGSKVILS